jgi:mono/diheme cytochrome c family protein
VILMLLVLLALDAARSLIGHFGYAVPATIWKPDPKLYADMTWPPASNVPPTPTPAERAHFEKCAFCHGPDGRDNGPEAPSMIPRPRDFTQGLFKYKSTPEGVPPSDDDLISTVTNGLKASGMPYFRGILSAGDIRGVIGVVKGFSKAFATSGAAPIAPPPRPAATPEGLAQSARLYKDNCAACHGEDLRGGQWLQDANGYLVVARDLTAPWTFRGGDAPEQIFLRLSTGLAPGPMPAFASLSPEDRWSLVNFLESKRRLPPWAAGGRRSRGARALPRPLRDARPLPHRDRQGAHLPRRRPLSRWRHAGRRLSQGTFISRNLTSDNDTGLGRWSEGEVATAIRDGRSRDGHVLNL